MNNTQREFRTVWEAMTVLKWLEISIRLNITLMWYVINCVLHSI